MQAGTVSAILNGTLGLNKTTAGIVTLSGVNTYTGLTNITVGTLALGINGALAPTSTLTVNGASAVLDMGASHTASVGVVTLTNGSITTNAVALTIT